jgi:hypothetical protein
MTRPKRDLGWILVCAAIGLLAATLVLAVTYIPDRGDGISPCQGSDFTESFDARSYETIKEDRLWPPGSVCRAYTPDGRFLREETYPKGGDWLLALATFLSPLALAAVYRRTPPLQRAAAWVNRR